MSFQYDTLNPGVIDRLQQIFSKPSTQWTEDEYRRAWIHVEVLKIVIQQYEIKAKAKK